MSHNCHAVIDVVDSEVPIWDEVPELGTHTKSDVVYCDNLSPYIRPNPFGDGVVRYCDEHVKIYDEALFELADETLHPQLEEALLKWRDPDTPPQKTELLT